jgi:hypothetical protein
MADGIEFNAYVTGSIFHDSTGRNGGCQIDNTQVAISVPTATNFQVNNPGLLGSRQRISYGTGRPTVGDARDIGRVEGMGNVGNKSAVQLVFTLPRCEREGCHNAQGHPHDTICKSNNLKVIVCDRDTGCGS